MYITKSADFCPSFFRLSECFYRHIKLFFQIFGAQICSVLQFNGDNNLDYTSFHIKEVNLFQKVLNINTLV